MTLRMKLVCWLVLAALLPMAVAVGVLMLRAGRGAEEETERRIESARRITEMAARRWEDHLLSRLAQAADDLLHDPLALDALIEDPGGVEAGQVAPALARRHGLDFLEVVDDAGRALSSSRPGATGDRSNLPEGRVQPRLLQLLPLAERRLALLGSHPLPLANREVSLRAALLLGGSFADEIAALLGEPTSLVDGTGTVLASSGSARPGPRVEPSVPLFGGGVTARLSLPEAEARRIRRELLATFGGVAPIALASALALGLLLAQGISRPIRALAARVEQIAEGRASPLSVPQPRDEVQGLTLSFEAMIDSLSDSERQRLAAERIAGWQDLARRIAHEVKNPLSPIKLAVENLRRTRLRAPERFDTSFEEETRTILEEVETLRRLVDEFSRFARLPEPDPVPCDPASLIRQVVTLYEPRMERAGVRLIYNGSPGSGHLPDLPGVMLDPEQIGQVLKNVLANALDSLEETGGAGERTIDIGLGKIDGPARPFVEISVTDSGTGLDEEALRRIFEPYYTTRSGRGGTGLGMAIAYRIVTEHGGTITAGRARGGGAVITIRLPFERPPARA